VINIFQKKQERRKVARDPSMVGIIFSITFLFLFFLSLTSATETFGYGLTTGIISSDGVTGNCPEGYVVQNITSGGLQCIEIEATAVSVNSTQFDSSNPISIKVSWVETFVNALSKWTNYWTKTENINQTGYNITADYFFGNVNTYNLSYHTWLANHTDFSKFWYNMTSVSTFNQTYHDKVSFNNTNIAYINNSNTFTSNQTFNESINFAYPNQSITSNSTCVIIGGSTSTLYIC
jgi:hypothetical protein